MERDTEEIKAKFLALNTRQDVADILGIEEKSLRYFLYAVKPDNMYYGFVIKKKSGGDRHIDAPEDKLKSIQRKLADILNCVYKIKPAAHGFVIDKDIATNAKNHVKRKYVFNMDLENFFEQIHFGRIRGMLMKPPYSIGGEAALVIAQIACYKGRLPQGAPTSPILTNMICAPLDTQLTKLARKYNLRYSRYADDITFSSKEEFPKEIVYTDFGRVYIGKEVEEIISKNSFIINQKKTRVFDNRKRQEVTGLVVNQFVNIKREYIKEIRAIMHHCKTEGIYESAKIYTKKGKCKNNTIIELVKDESEENKQKVEEWFKLVLKGKIGYIRHIKGKNSYVFLKYAKELNELFEEDIFRIDDELELLEKIEKSVFILESEAECIQGSGFIAKGVGLLTNYHVTEDNGDYTVSTYKSDRMCSVSNNINLIKNNKNIDYACYRFGAQSEDALEVGTSKKLGIGTQVLVIGYPDYSSGNSPEVQNAQIISERIYMGQRLYTINGRIVHGASGGVVLDESYKVVGIIRCGPATIDETAVNAVQGLIPIDDVLQDLENAESFHKE